MTGDIFGVILALAFVLALIVGGAYLMRRFSAPMMSQSNVAIRVLASTAVGQRERVVLVQAGDEQWLLGVAPGRVSVIDKPGEKIEVSQDQAFAQTLSTLMSRGRS